jgi:hypothetical protein
MANLPQIRRDAIELTLHQLQAPADANIYGVITRLCPRGVHDLLPLTLHLAEACGALLERDCGSRETAIKALQQQLEEGCG